MIYADGDSKRASGNCATFVYAREFCFTTVEDGENFLNDFSPNRDTSKLKTLYNVHKLQAKTYRVHIKHVQMLRSLF